MYDFGSYLSSDFHDVYLEFARKTYGIQKSSPLWRRCVRGTDQSIDMGVSRLFIKGSGFTNESVHQVSITKGPWNFFIKPKLYHSLTTNRATLNKKLYWQLVVQLIANAWVWMAIWTLNIRWYSAISRALSLEIQIFFNFYCKCSPSK